MNDLTGQRFGRRRVVRYMGRDSNGKRRWEWRCDCGKTGVTVEQSIKAGKSCGCYAVEKTVRRSTKHGMKRRRSAVPEYAVWTMMKRRCSDPNDPSFSRYGGRGIGYAERWETFEVFISDMGRRPSPRHPSRGASSSRSTRLERRHELAVRNVRHRVWWSPDRHLRRTCEPQAIHHRGPHRIDGGLPRRGRAGVGRRDTELAAWWWQMSGECWSLVMADGGRSA